MLSVIILIIFILINIILYILNENKSEIWYNVYIKLIKRRDKNGNFK